MPGFLTGENVTLLSEDLLDHRYFYIKNNRASYTCGLVRQALIEILRQHGSISSFRQSRLLSALRVCKTSPSTVGFLVEQILINNISSKGTSPHFSSSKIEPFFWGVAIEITVAKKHKDSEAIFFRDWDSWVQPLVASGYSPSASFIWVHPGNSADMEKDEDLKVLKNRTITLSPAHSTSWIPIEDINHLLAQTLKKLH